MKITLQIEVTNAEELSTIAQALGKVSHAEVSHDVTETVQAETIEAPKPAKVTRSRSTKPKEEKEEMIPVESPFKDSPSSAADVMAPTEPLVNTGATQQAPVNSFQGFPNAAAHIVSEAGRLEKANIPAETKKNVINSLLVEIQAPQGHRASQLPEPYLSIFAQNIGPKIDQALAQFSNAGLV